VRTRRRVASNVPGWPGGATNAQSAPLSRLPAAATYGKSGKEVHEEKYLTAHFYAVDAVFLALGSKTADSGPQPSPSHLALIGLACARSTRTEKGRSQIVAGVAAVSMLGLVVTGCGTVAGPAIGAGSGAAISAGPDTAPPRARRAHRSGRGRFGRS